MSRKCHPNGGNEWLEDITRRIIGEPRQLTEDTARKLIDVMERTGERLPLEHIRRNQLASALLGTVGIALFIVGVENAASDIPIISNAWGSMVTGLILLAVTGAMLTRLNGH